MSSESESERAELLARLRSDIAACVRVVRDTGDSAIRTGWPALDRALPGGGIPRGWLVELADAGGGCGAETVAAALTAGACSRGGAVVVIDRDRQFYPPGLAAWGVAFRRMIVVRPTGDAADLWAADQALRCPAVAVVWLRCGRLTPHDARRLRLAAEEGGALGLLFRPRRAAGLADVQLAVEPRPARSGRRLCVAVTRCRGGAGACAVEIEIGDGGDSNLEAPPVSATAELAHPAAAG